MNGKAWKKNLFAAHFTIPKIQMFPNNQKLCPIEVNVKNVKFILKCDHFQNNINHYFSKT